MVGGYKRISCAKMEISNLIVIPLLGSILMSSGTQHQKNRPIVYISEDLRKIRDNVCYYQQYRKLPGQTVKIIRNLRINKKKKRGSRAGRSKTLDQHRTVIWVILLGLTVMDCQGVE